MRMKILFIGGNGNISWYCVQKALEAGHEVWELNRGVTRATRRKVQAEVYPLMCDRKNADEMKSCLHDMTFDCVCDFICYDQTDAENAVKVFQHKTQHYIFISSESVYKRETLCMPFTEDSRQYDATKVDRYIAGKILAEQVFCRAYREFGFPVTIIRPGYTYDTILPSSLGRNCFTAMQKVLDGKPMLVLGDGINLWSPLHSEDFARAFIAFIGNQAAVGQSYHITGEKYYMWNEIAQELLHAFGIAEREVLHVSAETVEKIEFLSGKELTRQHMGHYLFDNSKMRTIASDWSQQILFEEGAQRTVCWLYEQDMHRRYDQEFAQKIDRVYEMLGV